MLFSYQLNKLLEEEEDKRRKVSTFAVEPGFVPQTELARESPWYVKFLMKYILPLASFTRTPEQVTSSFIFFKGGWGEKINKLILIKD